jgi:hypothetical protein
MVLQCTPETYNFLKSVNLFKKKLQIADIANGRTNERALSAILTVERGWNINKINLGAIDKLTLLQN